MTSAVQRRAATRSASDAITDRLREAITDGSYQPNERLVEEDVAQRLKTNRATLRVAMARLEQEGLILREHNRGARVRLVTEREAVEIFEIRAALEALVARQAAQRITASGIAHLRSMLSLLEEREEAGDYIGCADLSIELHKYIAEVADHKTATRLLENLKSQIVRFQFRAFFQPGRMEHSVAEHRTVINAIVAKDPDAAESAMREHLDNAVAALHKSIDAGHRMRL